MSDIRVIYEFEGKVSVMQPTDSALKQKTLGEIIKRSLPEQVPYVITDKNALPSDREFRDAWKLEQDRIDIDLNRAKDIQLSRLRKARDVKISALDGKQSELTSKGEDLAPIFAEKKRLRDITEPLKLANPSSLEEIKTLGNLEQV